MARGADKRGKNEDPGAEGKKSFGSFKDLLRSQGGEPEPEPDADERGWTLESSDGRTAARVGVQ